MTNEVILPDEKVRGAKVKPCDCYHPWSDKVHGKGLRVHNRMAGGGLKGVGTKGWRCVVCGKEK